MDLYGVSEIIEVTPLLNQVKRGIVQLIVISNQDW